MNEEILIESYNLRDRDTIMILIYAIMRMLQNAGKVQNA